MCKNGGKENAQIYRAATKMLIPGMWVLLCCGRMELENKRNLPTPVVFETSEAGLQCIKERSARHCYIDTCVTKRYINNSQEEQYEQVDFEGVTSDGQIHTWSLRKVESHNVEKIRKEYQSEAYWELQSREILDTM